MAEKDNKKLILFLESFKQELLAMVANMKTNVLKRSELENVVVFSNASDEEKNVIHELVNEVTVKGDELDTGHDGLLPVTDGDQGSLDNEGNGMGKAKTYASSHFQSDKEAA